MRAWWLRPAWDVLGQKRTRLPVWSYADRILETKPKGTNEVKPKTTWDRNERAWKPNRKATERAKTTNRGMKLPRVEFERARNREWFFRFKTRNGKIVCGPKEQNASNPDTYKRLQGAIRGFNAFASGVGGVSINHREADGHPYDVFVEGVKQ